MEVRSDALMRFVVCSSEFSGREAQTGCDSSERSVVRGHQEDRLHLSDRAEHLLRHPGHRDEEEPRGAQSSARCVSLASRLGNHAKAAVNVVV